MEYDAPMCFNCPMFVSSPKVIGGNAICKAYPKGIPQRIYFQACNCTKKPKSSSATINDGEYTMVLEYNVSAEQALQKLKDGNSEYLSAKISSGDISLEKREYTCENGQQPYAVIVTCSDSRVIPESIFSAGIGDLFVIRVAGNVIDDHQLGSIEYATEHLGIRLVVVLGHNHCGAVDAAINHDPEGYIKFITDEIKLAIGDEQDDYKACCLNVRHSVELIEQSFEIQCEEKHGLRVIGALYRLANGTVEFEI